LDKSGEKPETIQVVLGLAKSIIITKDDTTILHGNGEKYNTCYLGLKLRKESKSFKDRSHGWKVRMIRKNYRKG
jgi:hypothetical protein